MRSVLGKLIQQEFGRERYQIYTKKLNNRESMDIFCDIYVSLLDKSQDCLNESLVKLLDSVQESIQISKNFVYISLGYLVTVLALFFSGAVLWILVPALAAASLCYGYKFIEFMKNRYCDRDVRIVLIYKIALFHRLEENCVKDL